VFYQNSLSGFEELPIDLQINNSFTKHVLWLDFDNDLDNDIIVSNWTGRFYLFENDGNFVFTDITLQANLPMALAPNMGINIGDYDRDGWLDIFISRWAVDQNTSLTTTCRLFRNNGTGNFTDVTDDVGLDIPPTFAFQSVWMDYNNDLWPDLHVIVDKLPGNHFFENNSGQFTELTDDYNMSFPNNEIMSNSVADFNNDGYLDIFMTNAGVAEAPTLLLQNNSGLGFQSIGPNVGMAIEEFSWGAVWVDVNNDGWDDMYFCTPTNDPNPFYLNQTGASFNEMSNIFSTTTNRPSYAAAKGDFNNDGKYDIAVQSRAPYTAMCFVNQSSSENHFAKITLTGTSSNSMAIGSWIEVSTSEITKHEYTICGENYLSQNSQHKIIGVGQSETIDSISVTYPSGHTDYYYELPVDTHYHFLEGETYIASIEASDTVICEGEIIVLDAGEHAEYLWSNGETNQTIEVDSAGVYVVQVTNENGISASAEISVQVLPEPSIVETISPNPCNGDALASIDLFNNAGIEADSVSWSNGDFGTSPDSLSEGTYSYIFTDVNGCQSTGEVEIVDSPELVAFSNSTPSDPETDNGQINVTVFGGIAPYIILLEGDTVGTEIINLSPGSYELLIIDSYGCEIIITDIVESTLNTVEIGDPEIKIFPNPTDGILNIDSELRITKAEIRNVLGSIHDILIADHFKTISLVDQPGGIYFINLFDRQGKSHTYRVIKK